MRRCRQAILLALAGCLLVACGGEPTPTAAPTTVTAPVVDPLPEAPLEGALKIAAIFPVYGRFGISGEESHRGVRLAVEDWRERVGRPVRELQVLEYRTGGDPQDVREAARQASRAGALAIVGSNASRLSQSIAEFAQIHSIPMVSNVSTVLDLTMDPETGRNREFIFRVCHNDRVMGRFLAECARIDLKAKSAAVLYDVSRPYSVNLADTFDETFRESDSTRDVTRFYYGPLETDFRRQLRAIRELDPDVLFVPGSFIDASLIAEQAETIGLRATLLGGDSWSNKLLFKRKPPSRPVYHADHWFSGGPFRDLYVERYGTEPNGGRAALAYDAFSVIAHALSNLGNLTERNLTSGVAHTRDRLRRAIALGLWEGVTGTITFDRFGDPPQKGVIVKLHKGARTLFKDLED